MPPPRPLCAGRLEPPLLKALAAAVHDPRVLPSCETALRLTEVTLSRMVDMEASTAASWALTLLFTSGLPPGSPVTATVGDAAAQAELWQRQRAVTERACAALPGWAPPRLLIRLLAPQLAVLLAGGTAALTGQQRYSLIRLATLAGAGGEAADGAGVDGMEGVEGPAVTVGGRGRARASGGRGKGKGQGAGAGKEEGELPGVVLEALPAVCLDWFASQQSGQHGVGSESAAGSGPGSGAGLFTQAAAAGAAEAAAAATVLQLLQAHTQALLLPLVCHCAAVCQARCSQGEGEGGAGKGGPKGGKGSKAKGGDRSGGDRDSKAHSVECMRRGFMAAAALLQVLLQNRALGPALLREQQGVQQQLAALSALAQHSPQLSGDAACRAAAKQLEQVARDLFGSPQ